MNEFLRLEREAKICKERYPKGTRIELLSMNDSQAVPPGTRGTVNHVDDLGTIHMNWDNGRTLAICPQEDSFRKLTEQEIEQENIEKRSALISESTKLTAGSDGKSYDGYTTRNKWNGWDCPLFNKENALKICEANCNEYCQMSYDGENDCFVADYVQDGFSENFNGCDYLINGKVEHLYPVGSHSWTWEKVEQEVAEEQLERRSKIVGKSTSLTTDAEIGCFKGYITSNKCDGFECPLFDKENADKICKAYNDEICQMRYDEENDCFVADYPEDGYTEKYEGRDYIINGNIEHLYAISGYDWCWSIAEQEEIEDENNAICVEETSDELLESAGPTMSM